MQGGLELEHDAVQRRGEGKDRALQLGALDPVGADAPAYLLDQGLRRNLVRVAAGELINGHAHATRTMVVTSNPRWISWA